MSNADQRSSHNMVGDTVFKVDVDRFLWIVFLTCLIIEVALVYFDLTINWWRWSDSGAIRRLFNTTREDGLASWFAVSQTLLVALVAWLIVTALFHQDVSNLRRAGWILVAAFVTYLCVDDGAAVHERMGTAYKDGTAVSAYPSYSWQFVLLPLFAIMGGFMLCFLWRDMPRPFDRVKIFAAMGCFVAAVGMDFVEGLETGYPWLVQAFGWEPAAIRHFSKSVEEFVEMLGMSILLVTFIGHLARIAPSMVIHFQHPAR